MTLTALRDIEVGEELSYSYVSINVGGEDRRKAIQDTWGFDCVCLRCCVEAKGGVGEAGNVAQLNLFDRKHVCVCGAVCVEVDRTAGPGCVCHEAIVI